MKTEVMGLGMDTKLTYDADRFRKKYNINDPFILYAGRKDKGKNIDTLVQYFKRYKQNEQDNLKLVLIGGGELEIPTEIKNDVYDLGFVDLQDKYDAYGAAELLCQPSKNESFSLCDHGKLAVQTSGTRTRRLCGYEKFCKLLQRRTVFRQLL